MPNATMTKFGYPNSVVAETEFWSIQLRAKQPTLGSLVLICKEEALAFSEIGEAAHADMRNAITGIEAMLKAFVAYERINYLMLMMVDPHVHFHVLPRYEGERTHAGVAFPDAGWPGPPALDAAVAPDDAAAQDMRSQLAGLWQAS
ncbi:HIT family protein [Pararhizobium mangrovi]|uniref:HIT family protein n=1 Tax=Pararhizobium mangrovi TaxID=2590452 RepID=A0A506U7T6_9HYPH|nr:HIT family protein [Pararhizobium mangrovi]TPW29940.1 HIT family protein [Pararhizobium mangrovi]